MTTQHKAKTRWPKEDEIRWVEWELRRVRYHPDGEHSPIADNPSDLEIWLAHERDSQSWQQIGNARFPKIRPEARRSEARRAHARVDLYLRDPHAPEFEAPRLNKLIKEIFGVSSEDFRAFVLNGRVPKHRKQ